MAQLSITMTSVTRFSPAKINLFLAVTGKRDDGFHELVSLVAPISLGDEVRVTRASSSKEISLSCNWGNVPVDGTNLACRAAEAFRKRYGIAVGLDIHLEKRIPMGAGLGGGSSNAVAVLLALQEIFGVGEESELVEIASGLGADCPLFFGNRPLIMRGKGDVLEKLTDEQAARLQGLPLMVFKPSFGISTVEAYGALAADPKQHYCSQEWAEQRMEDWKSGEISIGQLMFNSFEKAVFEKHLALPVLKAELDSEFGFGSLMSGSGSACFMLLEKNSSEEKIAAKVEDSWGRSAVIFTGNILD